MKIVKVNIRDHQKETWDDFKGKGWNYSEWIRENEKDRFKKTRIHIDVVGENMIANFGNRAARPYLEWKPLVEAKLQELGIDYESIQWSQKAGCFCGCSPGFILKGHLGKTIWMDIEESPLTTNPALAANRVGQLLSDPTIVGAFKAVAEKQAQ